MHAHLERTRLLAFGSDLAVTPSHGVNRARPTGALDPYTAATTSGSPQKALAMSSRDPFSCDTSVALPPLTANGDVIFAKNSDRSPNEAQPLRHVPRQTHASDATLHTQYLEIPQVETTWELIGSAPYWLWGFEMGVNEWGVTIGNEAVHTREPSEERALIGMDLVRLGLERAQTAQEAVEIIGSLVERYGQGGSCEATFFRTYQNSFIVADATGAWILETAGHRWVATVVHERGAISNLLTIGETWDLSSAGIRVHAESQGWWRPEGGFAAAYQDPETDLSTRQCRLDRAREILGGYQRDVDVAEMIAVLRDHGDRDLPLGPEPIPTICMHANPAFPGETAASMVVSIRPNQPKLLTTTIWTAFGSPCLSVFRPVYPFAVGLPDTLANAGCALRSRLSLVGLRAAAASGCAGAGIGSVGARGVRVTCSGSSSSKPKRWKRGWPTCSCEGTNARRSRRCARWSIPPPSAPSHWRGSSPPSCRLDPTISPFQTSSTIGTRWTLR